MGRENGQKTGKEIKMDDNDRKIDKNDSIGFLSSHPF